MASTPSLNGIGAGKRTPLRIAPNKTESTVSTQRPSTSTPSPRGHA